MAWVGVTTFPDVDEVRFDRKQNCLMLKCGQLNCDIHFHLTDGKEAEESLPFLAKLRAAVDEAIQFNLDKVK